MKKRMIPVLMAILMVFAMMPMTAGTVFADADMTPPEFDLSTLKAEISSGEEIALVGDTVTISVKVADDRGLSRVQLNLLKPDGNTVGYKYMQYNAETGFYECSFEITADTSQVLNLV